MLTLRRVWIPTLADTGSGTASFHHHDREVEAAMRATAFGTEVGRNSVAYAVSIRLSSSRHSTRWVLTRWKCHPDGHFSDARG